MYQTAFQDLPEIGESKANHKLDLSHGYAIKRTASSRLMNHVSILVLGTQTKYEETLS
jgi:hypothetical protein